MTRRATLDPFAPRASFDAGDDVRIEIEDGPAGLAAALAWLAARFVLEPAAVTVREDAGVTVEGERVALLEAPIGLQAIVCALVDADVTSVRITGFGPTEACRARVAELARTTRLGLGLVRRRRYRFAPPPGWSGRQLGLYTELRPPSGLAVIGVAPALPIHTGPPLLDLLRLEQGLGDLAEVRVLESRSMRSDDGLVGPLRVEAGLRGGDRRLRATASLADSRFLYCARLDARADAPEDAQACFLRLLGSIRRVPDAQRREPCPPAFAAWVD